MQAKDLMTTNVVMVEPDTSVREIAKVLLEFSISAVPVVDASGTLVGMVSEGDIIGRKDADRSARRDWWLGLVAGDEEPGTDWVDSFGDRDENARDVMTAPVVTVTEDTDARKVAQILTDYRIKRAPVVRGGDVVGIVSREDLVRALATIPPSDSEEQRPRGIIFSAFSGSKRRAPQAGSAPGASQGASQGTSQGTARGLARPAEDLEATEISAADFRELVEAHHRERARRREQALEEAARLQQEMVQQLASQHVEDKRWQELLAKARRAAANGKKQIMLLRFPSQLCSDGGREINANQEDWPTTLRGEPAELYLRWEQDLKDRGFKLTAQVLNFPGGIPGDIGLFLAWGN